MVVVVAAAAFLWPLYNGTRRVASLGMRDTLVPSSATLWPVASAVASSLRAALSDCCSLSFSLFAASLPPFLMR